MRVTRRQRREIGSLSVVTVLSAFSVAVLSNWGYLAAIAGAWIVGLLLIVRPWRKDREPEEAERSRIGLSWGDTADPGVNPSGSPE